MRGFEGRRFKLYQRNLKCSGFCLFASVFCNLNRNLLCQANLVNELFTQLFSLCNYCCIFMELGVLFVRIW